MISFVKLKYTLVISAVCLLGGCDKVQDIDKETIDPLPSNVTITENPQLIGQKDDKETINPIPSNVTVTVKPKVTGVKELPDSPKSDEEKLKEGIALIQDKKYPQAIGLLSEIKNNEQAKDLLEQLRYIISGSYIANLGVGVAAIDKNGKVKVIIDDANFKYYQYGEATKWKNIKSISCAFDRLDALDKNGVIHSTKGTDPQYTYIVDQLKLYTNLSVIATDFDNYVLLSKKGKIYVQASKGSDGKQEFLQDHSSTWKDVTDVIIGQSRIGALKRDGTVYVADSNKIDNPEYGYMYDEIGGWTDIASISADEVGSIAGLKYDGTVVVSTDKVKGITTHNIFDVSDWKDIIAISKSNSTLLGLKRDGTVVATGSDVNKQLDVLAGEIL